MTQDLQQVRFSVRDTVVTRQQLAITPILTARAAERIVDFCPNLLWRGTLLRMLSEAGWGNKDVRERFCRNGCYCDKATFTKRVSAALGYKQQQQTQYNASSVPEAQGPTFDGLSRYQENVKAFFYYIDFFGKRTGHHNKAVLASSTKRRLAEPRSSNLGPAPSTEPCERHFSIPDPAPSTEPSGDETYVFSNRNNFLTFQQYLQDLWANGGKGVAMRSL